MATIKPFQCIRPKRELVKNIAALPYDVYSSREAKKEVERESLSFLKIDRAETAFKEEISPYDQRVYQKAGDILNAMLKDGSFLFDEEESYYVYELIMNGRSQTGIVACAAINDYLDNTIKKHENTREEKEQDRIRHVDSCSAQTGPIFLAYRYNSRIQAVLEGKRKEKPLYQFIANDGISHRVWKIGSKEEGERVRRIREEFAQVRNLYIADGHHRAASAVKVGLKRREQNPGYTGEEEFNYFLSVLFPDSELMILPYNRVVRELGEKSEQEIFTEISSNFHISLAKTIPFAPEKKGDIGMYLAGKWYRLEAKPEICSEDPVDGLDVSVLQNYLLDPVFGIKDPRKDERLEFVGGIRGLKELEKRAEDGKSVAFSMYPTSIEELFAVADAGMLMPPKSTWFEPKLRSGIFIHRIEGLNGI